MAQTKKGIIYPNDYEQIADIPEDLKNLAESVDDAIDKSVSVLEKQIIEEMEKAEEGFNSNAKIKLNEFNNNVETKTTDFNKNAETKTEEFNTNATNKVNEFNNNVDSLENELTELASQMPWNTTEIASSIHVEDSAKYSRNKLNVFGNLYQETSEIGNNKFDGILEAGNIGYETGLNEVSDSRVRSKNYIDVSGATKITIVAESEYETAISIGLRLYDKDYNYIGRNAVSDFTKSVSFNVSAALIDKTTVAKYCRFNVVDTDITKKFSVNINETLEYEDYIPNKPSIEYPSMPVVATGVQKIKKIGKNFLNVEKNASSTALGVTATTDENGIITMNGTTSAGLYLGLVEKINAIDYSKISQLVKSKLSKGVYKVSFKYISGTVTSEKNNTNIQFRDDLTTANSTITKSISNLSNSNKEISVTLDKNKECFTYLWADTNTVFADFKFTVHIEKVKSETDLSTDYEPYTEETFELDLGTTELCKIVDGNNNVVAQDRAVYKDGKWQIEKQIGKVVFDGSESDWIRYVATSPDRQSGYYKLLDTNTRYAISNYYKYSNKADVWSIPDGAFSISASSNICFVNCSITTLNDFKEWLSTHNTEVYYKLAEIIYIDCTQEQSQVLDKLYKLQLQKGINNIFVESENGVTTELQLTYMQDLMSQINELKQAMLNIGGN